MAQKYPDKMVVMNRLDKSWASALSAWQQYRMSRGKASSNGQLDSTMSLMGDRVSEAYDVLADALGESFIKGDHYFGSDVEDIEKTLLIPLSTSLKGLHCDSNGQSDPSGDYEAQTTQLALKAVAMTIRTLERLASRLGYNIRPSERSGPSTKPLCDDSDEIDWCKGALLIQQSPSSYESTIVQPTNQLGKICKFCYLEISDYRTKAVHHVKEDWSALASCHVLACSSFKDQRAAYRCFGCYVSGVSNVLISTAAMFDHIATCEEFTEKRKRSQTPLNTIAAGHGRNLPRRAQLYFDSPAISTPDTTSTNSTQHYSDSSAISTPDITSNNSVHTPAPTPVQLQSQARPPLNSMPFPTRNPPPVPPTEGGRAHPPRPKAPVSLQSIPGGFPMADPMEKSYQPQYAQPTPNTQQQASSPTPRKPVGAPQPPPPQSPQSPQSPQHAAPMSPSRGQRRSWNASIDESSSPPLPPLPAQVRQLMEMGITKSEAEHGLKETNWDVQQAADLIWRSRQAR